MVEIKNGFTPKRTDETLWNPKEIPWFTVEDIHDQGVAIYRTAQFISRNALGRSRDRIIPPHTVLLCCTSATIGRYAMTEIELTTNQQWNGLVIKEEYKHIICSDYILVWVSSLKEKMTEIAKSTTFPFLSVDKLANFAMPIPPIEEQHKIVDKITEIMPKIDEYEKIEKELEALKKEYPTNMKDALLQAAMQGKLTEQLESDSSVDELLVAIQKEKEALIAQKKIKKEKPLPDIEEEEIPFDIPDNWRWERLGSIGIYKKGPFGSALTKSIFVPKGKDTVKVYEQKNAIQKDATLGEYYITKEYFDSKMKGFIVESGDIIVSCAGTIGETYIMPNNIEIGIINQALMRMNLVTSLNIDYFLIYFDNILKLEAQKGSKGSAIKNIPPFEVFKRMLIPIPPIEEQNRIVERLNALLSLCEDLKE